ncbi:MAG: RIP metalloprotease RseP [Acidobacteria bacterium]|nr:RIP metalloprotease RseP [Acidobacteriota bacterium]
MTTLLAFAFVLGVLVFVHELGHFMMARWHGVRVFTFSLGFGPKLLSVKRGDTEYAISAIPLGGYVKMAGENAEDQRTGADDEFLSKTKWQRFQILIMGPVMNLALAVILMAVVLMQGAEIPSYQDQPVAVGVVEAGSAAESAGVRPGDVILEVGGDDVPSWDKFLMAIGTRAGRDVELTVMRDGREERFKVRPASQGRFEIGDIGVLPDVYPSVASLVSGGRAEEAGLQRGDVIVAINDQRVVFSQDVVNLISKNRAAPMLLRVRRGGADQVITVQPPKESDGGLIGITIANETVTFRPGPLEAVGLSVERNIEFSGLILKTLWGLVVGETSPRQLMGPVGIAQLSGESAQAGWVALFALMASISLNLGLLNLMPVPVLDGGHILIMGLEAVARRDFSIQVKEKMFLAGFMLLMLLMVTVIYNDLTRISWIERLMPWRN